MAIDRKEIVKVRDGRAAAYPGRMDVPRRLAVGGPRGGLGYVVAVAGTILITLPRGLPG